jgi:hypothetical protein
VGHANLWFLGSLRTFDYAGHPLLALVVQTPRKASCQCWVAEVPCKQKQQ